MRIVVTGASGNVGSAVLRRLSGTEHEVVGVARRTPDPEPPFDRAGWVGVDLSRDDDEQRLRDALTGADAVVHLAWGFQPSHDERYLRELGVGGTRRVVAAALAAGVPHVLHLSSVGAYSPKQGDRPVDESWPTAGVPTSRYSRHKSEAERFLDGVARDHPGLVLTRLRPGIVGQHDAGSALLRYGLPALVPSAALGLLPVLPLDGRLALPVVHADDLADAVVRAVERGAGGAFNLAAPPVLTASDVAAALGTRHVPFPAGVLRAAVAASWAARVQPLDPGWLDLAYSVPVLDTARAREELGWEPATDALSTLRQTIEGMRRRASGPSAVLRPRTVASALGSFVRRGPVSGRERP